MIGTTTFIEVATINPLLSDLLVSLVEKEDKKEITSISHALGFSETLQTKPSRLILNSWGYLVFSQLIDQKNVFPDDFIEYMDTFSDTYVYAKTCLDGGSVVLQYRTDEGWWEENLEEASEEEASEEE